MPVSQSQPRSIRWQMFVWVNTVLMTAMLAYLAWDYFEDWNRRISEKRSTMLEEARVIAPAAERLSGMLEAELDATARVPRKEAVERFLNRICERKQVSEEVDYQLFARIDGVWCQAQKNARHAAVPANQLDVAVRNPHGIIVINGESIVVVRDTVPHGSVYVVESITKIMREGRKALLWHFFAIACIGAGVTAIVNLILLETVSKPLGALVATLRRIKSGELGIKAPRGSSREVESLVNEVNQLSHSLAVAQTHRVRQMDKARRVQERLFPSGTTAGPLKVQSVHTAASIVGGDYFDHKVMPDGSIMVILVDVSGHGVPAAMGAAMLKALFDANTRNATGLLQLVTAINQGFCEVSLDEDFATIIIVSISPDRRRIQYINAGHETAYVIPRGLAVGAGGAANIGDEVEASVDISSGTAEPLREMKSTGPLVGVMRDAEWTVGELPFEPGDRAVLLTDGVVECRSLAGEMLGRSRVCTMLLRARDTPFESFTAQVIGDIESFRAGIAPNDDLTLLTLEY
jgi:sigma-B regulation protein RsbU (phosphoserine phosphatase)